MSSTTFLHCDGAKVFEATGSTYMDESGQVCMSITVKADYTDGLHLFLSREQLIETREAIDNALREEEKLVSERKVLREQEPNDTSDIECSTEDDIPYPAPL